MSSITEQTRLIGFDNNSIEQNSLLVSYNKNDFWYMSTNSNIRENLPTYVDCSNMNFTDTKTWESTCNKNNSNLTKNIQNCIRRELCVNRQYAEEVTNLQNNHNGSDQNYLDTKRKYSFEYLQSINLGIGVAGVIYVIYTLLANRNIP